MLVIEIFAKGVPCASRESGSVPMTRCYCGREYSQNILKRFGWVVSMARIITFKIEKTSKKALGSNRRIVKCFHSSSSFFGFFPSGVATADFPSPVVSINCIFLRHFNLSHVLFHHIHKPPFWPSVFPLSWQLHPQHPSPNIPIIFPP